MKIILSSFSLIFLILFSCTKENTNNPAFNDSIPKILSVTEYFNGNIERVTNFSYDSSSRLIKVTFHEMNTNQKYYDTLRYSGSTVTMTTYDLNHKMLESEIYTLNSDNLAVVMIDTLGEEKKSAKRHLSNFIIQEFESNIYGYDGSGYQTLEVSTNEYGGTHRYENSYSDGNVISSTFQFMAKDTVIQNGASAYKYYTDKSNTIGNQNRGISFMGKQNTNLLASISDLKWQSYDTLKTTTAYRYEFDSKKRVIKQYVTPQTGESDDVTYLTFTYR
jgi:hypothetical protein